MKQTELNNKNGYPDIRKKEWRKLNCDAARLLNLLISAEDIFISFDEYQMENGQCYPEIEDMMLEIGELRDEYIKFVEKNKDILDINIL